MNEFIRLHITAEGQTEERFVKDTLAPHLGKLQISTDVRRILFSKNKRKHLLFRGGLLDYEVAKKDIQTWLKEDKHVESRFTTMFDLYALPNSFPAYDDAQRLQNPYQRVEMLEKAFQEEIGDYRFIPYIQLHEFEALVLANPSNLGYEYFEHTEAIKTLQNALQQTGGNPELINDNPLTAPSKRILKVIPEYEKVSVGADIAAINGLEFLKETCSHFSRWIETLEKLSNKS